MSAIGTLVFFTFATLLGASSSPKGPAQPEVLNTQTDRSAPTTVTDEKITENLEEPGIHVGGMGLLSAAGTLLGDADFDTLILQGEFRWTDNVWGVTAMPRMRVKPLGTFSDHASLFFQQLYGSYKANDGLEIKAGQVYQHFGRFWDFGVYGPLVANTDLKLRPDVGLSLEGAPQVADNLALEYALQYFAFDGKAIALSNNHFIDRSTMRHRNMLVLRIVPTLELDRTSTVAMGFSGKRFTSYGSDPLGHQVLVGAVDLSVTTGPAAAFVEAGVQKGASAALASPKTNFSTTGTIDPYSYLWAGAQYHIKPFDLRFNINATFFQDAAKSVEVLYQPGVGYAYSENLDFSLEGAFWTSTNPLARANPIAGAMEMSIYLVALGHI